MQIRCPHCGTTFESATADVSFCPNCGQSIDVGARQSDALPPGAVPPPDGTWPPSGPPPQNNQPTPWERRAELGPIQAFWETLKEVALTPEKFWNTASPHGSLWDALSFAWICSAISSLLSLPFQFLQSSKPLLDILQKLDVPPETQRSLAMALGSSGKLALVLGGVLLYPLTYVIVCGLMHVSCLVFGVSKNGFNATARAIGYAAAPGVLGWLPIVGFGAAIYTIVLEVWGLARLQGSTYGRAAAAVLAPLVLILCCCCGIAALGFGAAMSAASHR